MPEPLTAGLESTADISSCGLYRYRLTRTWKVGGPPLGWVMLNPSTADAALDDPTIRRCMAFAKANGYGGITVANLFAWRATDPAELLTPDDPVGPDNIETLEWLFRLHDTVVAAWGARFNDVRRRRRHVLNLPAGVGALARRHGCNLVCLGTTKDGSPKHPLYVPAAAPFTPWEPT